MCTTSATRLYQYFFSAHPFNTNSVWSLMFLLFCFYCQEPYTLFNYHCERSTTTRAPCTMCISLDMDISLISLHTFLDKIHQQFLCTKSGKFDIKPSISSNYSTNTCQQFLFRFFSSLIFMLFVVEALHLLKRQIKIISSKIRYTVLLNFKCGCMCEYCFFSSLF